MAKLYLLRAGTGDSRIASSFNVSVEDVKRSYCGARVQWSERLLPINVENGPANSIANPQFPVVELAQGEVAFGDFKSPGFNLILDISPEDAYNRLVARKEV